MTSPIAEFEFRVDTGRSGSGTFVRVVHVPSGIERFRDSIGTRNPGAVAGELRREICEVLANQQPRFGVWRLDDNGNEFLVRGFWSIGDAHALREELAARGHKQTYWVRDNDA